MRRLEGKRTLADMSRESTNDIFYRNVCQECSQQRQDSYDTYEMINNVSRFSLGISYFGCTSQNLKKSINMVNNVFKIYTEKKDVIIHQIFEFFFFMHY